MATSHLSFTEINLPHIYLAARVKREGEVEAVEVAHWSKGALSNQQIDLQPITRETKSW